MNTLIIEATEDTPRVLFDTQEGCFEVSGRSLPEDCATFYKPVLEWLSQYQKEPLQNTVFQMKLEYFNTASSKIILDLLMKFEKIKELGKNVQVDWYYYEDDEDMLEAGQEFSEMIDLPFEYKIL